MHLLRGFSSLAFLAAYDGDWSGTDVRTGDPDFHGPALRGLGDQGLLAEVPPRFEQFGQVVHGILFQSGVRGQTRMSVPQSECACNTITGQHRAFCRDRSSPVRTGMRRSREHLSSDLIHAHIWRGVELQSYLYLYIIAECHWTFDFHRPVPSGVSTHNVDGSHLWPESAMGR